MSKILDLQTITSVKPGSAYLRDHRFFYYVLVNNIEMYDMTPFDSRKMCEFAMREEVVRLHKDHGV